jgi:methionyl-tRNA formyltransferase
VIAVSPPRKLRVHFITEDDPLYVVRFFEVFLSEYPRDELEITGMTVQAPFNESKLATAKRIMATYGAVDFVRLAGRLAARKLRRHSIGALARAERIPDVPATSVNEPDFVRRIRAPQPDVIVSVAAPEIFRSELLEAANLGCINVHSGRLPVYRGMMPTFWQMRFGEPNATVTVHEMALKLDAGGVLGTVDVPIREHDSLHRVITETKAEAAHLVIRVLRDLAAGTSSARLLDLENASYYSFPTREDSRAFRRRGHRML